MPRPVSFGDSHQTPSAVLVRPTGIRAGLAAVHEAMLHPDAFLESPKLLLGEPTTMLGGTEVEVVELVAAVLALAADAARRQAGGADPDRVVLTHPRQWARHRLDALRQAWARAGVAARRVELVAEPIAAVSHYAASRPLAPGATVAVLDIGAGTTDFAVVTVSPEPGGGYRVIGHDGDDSLGGLFVDGLIRAHVLRTLESVRRQPELARRLAQPGADGQWLAARRTLDDQIRRAKEFLSRAQDAPIIVPGLPDLVDEPASQRPSELQFTARELEDIVGPTADRIVQIAQGCLRGLGRTVGDVEEFYLTGGSSQLRPISDRINRLRSGRPAYLHDPKTVTALGSLSWVPTASHIREPAPLRRPPPPTGDQTWPPPPDPDTTLRVVTPPSSEPGTVPDGSDIRDGSDSRDKPDEVWDDDEPPPPPPPWTPPGQSPPRWPEGMADDDTPRRSAVGSPRTAVLALSGVLLVVGLIAVLGWDVPELHHRTPWSNVLLVGPILGTIGLLLASVRFRWTLLILAAAFVVLSLFLFTGISQTSAHAVGVVALVVCVGLVAAWFVLVRRDRVRRSSGVPSSAS